MAAIRLLSHKEITLKGMNSSAYMNLKVCGLLYQFQNYMIGLCNTDMKKSEIFEIHTYIICVTYLS